MTQKVKIYSGSSYTGLAQMAYDSIGNCMVLTGWVWHCLYNDLRQPHRGQD